MRKSRFTEEQMIAALNEHAAGAPAIRLRRTAGGWGWKRWYRWKHKYDGVEASEGAVACGRTGGEGRLL